MSIVGGVQFNRRYWFRVRSLRSSKMNGIVLSGSVMIYNGLQTIGNKLHDFMRKQDGVTAIEYAVIAVAISGLLMAIFKDDNSSFIGVLKAKFNLISDNVKGTVN